MPELAHYRNHFLPIVAHFDRIRSLVPPRGVCGLGTKLGYAVDLSQQKVLFAISMYTATGICRNEI